MLQDWVAAAFSAVAQGKQDVKRRVLSKKVKAVLQDWVAAALSAVAQGKQDVKSRVRVKSPRFERSKQGLSNPPKQWLLGHPKGHPPLSKLERWAITPKRPHVARLTAPKHGLFPLSFRLTAS